MKCFKDEKRSGCNRVSVLLMTVMLLCVCVQAAVVPSTKQTLDLKPGWNLVTLTRPLDSMSSNVQKFLMLKPVRYDVGHGTYVYCERAEDVKAGVGYWVFSDKEQTVDLAVISDQTVTQPLLQKGWNLVGMVDGAAWPDSNEIIWSWQNGRFEQVNDKLKLKAGNAYWVYKQ